MTPADLAVVAAHVTQAAAVRALLADLPDVLVGTANQLQGMERPAAVVLHPLAGYRGPNAFGTDPGRACVMLSRHRAHLSVVTDAATPAVLAGPDPTPATRTHRTLLAALTAASTPELRTWASSPSRDGQAVGLEVKGFPSRGYADPARADEVKRTSPST